MRALSAMNVITSSKVLLVTSVIAGVTVWGVFAAFGTEPWDSPYGWIAVAGLGLIFGFLGKRNPMLWPLGIFLGEVLFCFGSFLMSMFLYSGGGVNLFFPIGLIFLVPFTIPAFVGSFIGFGIRKVTNGA